MSPCLQWGSQSVSYHRHTRANSIRSQLTNQYRFVVWEYWRTQRKPTQIRGDIQPSCTSCPWTDYNPGPQWYMATVCLFIIEKSSVYSSDMIMRTSGDIRGNFFVIQIISKDLQTCWKYICNGTVSSGCSSIARANILLMDLLKSRSSRTLISRSSWISPLLFFAERISFISLEH